MCVRQTILRWDKHGVVVGDWSRIRPTDMRVTPNGNTLVVTCHQHRVRRCVHALFL